MKYNLEWWEQLEDVCECIDDMGFLVQLRFSISVSFEITEFIAKFLHFFRDLRRSMILESFKSK